MIKLSVVSPCYNEEKSLPSFLAALALIRNELHSLQVKTEFVVVDDCSTDQSVRILMEALSSNRDIRLVRNDVNLGVYRATQQGLRVVSGDIVLLMFPVDLQDPPEDLIAMVRKKIGADATGVLGRKIQREEGLILRGLREAFYALLAKMNYNGQVKNVGEFGVVDRWVVEEILKKDDYYPFIRSMLPRITKNLIYHDYVWKKRDFGKSNFSLFAYIDHAINGLLSSGVTVFRPMMVLGVMMALLSSAFGLLNLVQFIFDAKIFQVSGIASLLVTVSFGFGVVFILLAIAGELLLAIHSQVRRIYHVERVNEINHSQKTQETGQSND